MVTSGAQVQHGHETPFIRQFSVFLPNRVGQLSELLDMLAEEEVQVAGICVVDATEWAVVRMVFTDVGKARAMLARHGVAFTEADALAVVLDEPAAFRQVCKILVAAELNITFAYPLLLQRDEKPVLVFHVDDEIMARKVLTKHGFALLDHEEM